MDSSVVRLGLLREIFVGDGAARRLAARLAAARALGAGLVLLPELPLNRWSFGATAPREEDAEPPAGPRHQALSRAAAEAGVAVVGGAIVCDPATGRRHNTALAFDAAGRLAAAYRKLHLPDEEGFRETCHYEPGTDPPAVFALAGVPAGLQVCSDVNRPEGSHLLAAAGAELILAPRATEAGTWSRWRLVLQANALTSCAFVATVTRPAPEDGVPLGGPSAVFGPDGATVIETEEPLAIAMLDRAAVVASRSRYPGYMPVRADVYARGWSVLAEERRGR
jgi:predicted amidohydrolase